jgi:3-dehydroquinate dehydratase-1
VLSWHDFSGTLSQPLLIQKFLQAQQLGADVAKVAVMPHTMDDVLTLLMATRQASSLLNIPIISLSMGHYGVITRLMGWTLGSALTFAVGAESSAPGQVPIEDMHTVLQILRKSMVNAL